MSDELIQFMNSKKISIAFTSPHTDELYIIGCTKNEKLTINANTFENPWVYFSAKDHNIWDTVTYIST